MAAQKVSFTNLLVGFAVIIGVAYFFLRKEGYQSPGTLVQLATSHVPTAEDYYYYRNIYPQVVRRDIIDMTGGDPGPIAPYYPG